MNVHTLKLFNAICTDKKESYDVPEDICMRTIKHGYIVDGTFPTDEKVLNDIEKVIGISGEKANASFHKSWGVVKDTPMETLVIQQIMHYITTYGFEALGIYDEKLVYVPVEDLDLPEVKTIPITVVGGITKQELFEKVVELGFSGIALHQETLDSIMEIVKESNFVGCTWVEDIKNRELKALLYDHYGIVPSDPEEFLRHVISKITDESLLIKNTYLIEKIKASNGKFLDELMKQAPENLASIFYRYKPLFLAMRGISKNKKFFNQLRRKAKKMHAPLPEDYLNSITGKLKKGAFDADKLNLVNATVWRKIRLAYALSYRLNSPESIVYTVRNGRGWATEFDFPKSAVYEAQKALAKVIDSIAFDMQKNVKGKVVYIPENVIYAIPATEKQFIGNIPNGSAITVPEDMVFGIHWVNPKGSRIDLDLSTISIGGKVGWDSMYRNEDASMMFSGDLTDAPRPKGSSELFYVKEGIANTHVVMVNYYNFNEEVPVECKVLVAEDKIVKFKNNHMIDVNKIQGSTNFTIDKKQNVIGMVRNVGGVNTFYFTNFSIGNSITSYGNANSDNTRKYLESRMNSLISFNYLLARAGADVVREEPVGEYIDLSPEALDKGTFIKLLG